MFGATSDTSKEYGESLRIAYAHDKWNIITGEEVTETAPIEKAEPTPAAASTPRTDPREEVRQLYARLGITPGVAIKRVEHKTVNPQKDELSRDEKARRMYQMAECDVSADNVGRVLLNECRSEFNEPHLQIQELLEFWRASFPLVDVAVKGKALLIYWDGKQETIYQQRARQPRNLEENKFAATVDDQVPTEKYDTGDFKAHRPEDRIF